MGIYRRNKIWWMCFKSLNGTYIRQSTETSNKKTAKAIYHKQEVAVAENKFLDVRRQSQFGFREFARLFLERHCKPKKRSWKKSDAVYLKHLERFFGDKYLSKITQEMVEEYIATRKAAAIRQKQDGLPRYVTPATVNRELACLNTLFNKAIEWGKAWVNPCVKVRRFKEDNKRTRFLNEEEMKRFNDAASQELRQILTLLIHTGMRKGELQNLKWADLDFNRSQIALIYTKNGKVRHIPMNVAVKGVLLQRRIAKRSQVWVFPGRDDKPYDFRKAFETARRKVGLEDVRVHDLRHTFASHLCMNGAELKTVKELLGHSSLAMTERYSHLTDQHMASAVARLESLPLNHVTAMSQSGSNEESKDFENLVSSLKSDN